MKILIFAMILISGCSSVPKGLSPEAKTKMLAQAEEALLEGEFYRARKLTEQVLNAYPEDYKTVEMMELIEAEKSLRYERLKSEGLVEEMDGKQRLDMAQTWLERSREFLAMREYQQAVRAAEEIFRFDPDNVEASEFIDHIKREARQAGVFVDDLMRQLHDDEVHKRVQSYYKLAEKHYAAGRHSQARFALQKILLVSPRHLEALRLYEQIEQQQGEF